MEFYVFAVLALGLFSLFDKDLRMGGGTYAGFGFLAALAPVLAKGVSSIIGRQKAKGEAKKQAAYEQQQLAADEAAKRSAFEDAQDAPAAAMQRLKFNTGLAKILGLFGGREKTPQFLQQAFDTARQRKAYTPGPAAVPKPQQGGGFWNFASGLQDALGYLDPSKLTKKPGSGVPMIGNVAPTSPGQPVRTAFQSPTAVNPLLTQTKRSQFL